MDKKGFTLVEVMTVVVIAGILIASSLFVLHRTGSHYRLRTATLMLRQEMALTRQLSKERGRDYGISFSEGKWHKIFLSESGDTVLETTVDLPANISFGLQPGVTAKVSGSGSPPIDGIDFINSAVIFFNRSATPGVVYLTSGDETKAIEINSLGNPRIYDWNSDGSNWKKDE